jgi:tetratricopeptide (TPR) repeat protein
MISRALAAWVLVVLTAPAALAQASREQLLARAKADLEAGRGAEAARLLADAGDRFGSAAALVQLARWQAAEGDASAALVTLRKARILAPNSEDVLGAYARVALAARVVTPAIIALQALTRMAPAVADNHYLLGVARMQGGDYVAAAEALEQANRIAPDNARTLTALGLAANARKMYADARDAFLRAIAADPTMAKAQYQASLAYARLGDADAADRHVALYRKEMREAEERLQQVRTATDVVSGEGSRP